MQFKVPQFIDIEDKIFGPFTFKQFVYLAGGAGLTYILYRTLPLFIAILAILPVLGLSIALTFMRVNDRPFIEILQAGFNFLFKNKLYLWKKKHVKKEIKKEEKKEKPLLEVSPRLTASRLKDLAWSVDVLDIKQK